MIIDRLIKNFSEPSSFTDKAISDDTVLNILESARLAPSADNSQIWRFFVVKEAGLLKDVSSLAKKSSFKTAPVIIAVFADPWIVSKRGREQPFFMIDIPIAISHIVLMATELEISTAVEFEFDEQKIIDLFNPPKKYRAVALIALGYKNKLLTKKDVNTDGMIRDS
jgi:nitroreductase